MRRWKLLVAFIGTGLVLSAALLVAVLAPRLHTRPRETPHFLKQLGVKKGAGFLTKRTLFSSKDLWIAQYVGYGEFNAGRGPEVCVTDHSGAYFLSPTTGTLTSRSRVAIDPALGLRPIDVDGDHVCEFMTSRGRPALFDHRGRLLWEDTADGADEMCAGDINGDGSLEFAVGCAGDGGVRLLDRRGKLLWQQPDGSVWSIAMTDVNGDGRLEIVHSNVGGEMVVRDRQGRRLSAVRPVIPRLWPPFPVYLGDFAVCRWPRSADRDSIIIADHRAFFLFDFRGRVKARYAAPGLTEDNDVYAATVKLREDGPEYLAIIADTYINSEHSFLCVFDQKGTAVYEETLPGTCEAVAAMPIGTSGAEALLVGGQGEVYEYRAAALH